MKTALIKINSREHSVFIGERVFIEINNFLAQKKYTDSTFFILADENTCKHCLPVIRNKVPELSKAVLIKIKSGEENKNIGTCMQVWEELSKNNADRKSVLISLGGGVTSDLGGFIASTYKRGIDFITIPTTLLAQVDASIGGKSGIDFKNIKNEIGVFSFPKAVFIYTGFLKTLDDRQLLSGFAEIIKHALISDKNYWKKIMLSNDFEKWITPSVKIKIKIITGDPYEKNIRKKLNFGHTIGHAIESFSLANDKNKLLHGEAIAIGMVCESYLSFKEKLLVKKDLEEITAFILSKYKPYDMNRSSENKIIRLMLHDKKNEAGKINFTLLKGIGNALINRHCDTKSIKESFNYYRSNYYKRGEFTHSSSFSSFPTHIP